VKKDVRIFLLPEDETKFAEALHTAYPTVRFVDGVNWPTATPPARDTIAACTDSQVLIWDTATHPTLPSMESPHGYFVGPQNGPVVEWSRNRIRGDELLSGRLAAGVDNSDKDMLRFVRAVWRILTTTTVDQLRWPDGTAENDIRVGHAAFDAATRGQLRLLDGRVPLTPA
jgi:hypothetical protein